MAIRRKYIRKVVTEVLASSGVHAPAVPVDRIARQLGVGVLLTASDEELSGFILRNEATGQVTIGVNSNHPPNRQRFTIAHELAHFLLHQGQPVHVDNIASYSMATRDARSSTGKDPQEVEANLFAAELLMPVEFLETDLKTANVLLDLSVDDAVEMLARRYQVSVSAMTFRLSYLGYIEL